MTILNNENFHITQNETAEEYFVRLFEHKRDYDITCEKIAELLNEANHVSYGESAWRKEYAAFNRGRLYEREQQNKDVFLKILALSDFHYPFQLPVTTFSDYAGIVDVLVLNGDLMDMQSCSRFPKQYRINFMEEMIGCRQYLIDLIDFIGPKKVVVTYGNHEIRSRNYLTKNIDNEMKELLPDTMLDLIFNDGFFYYDKKGHTKIWYEPLRTIFEEIQIEFSGDWHTRIGKTIFAHPLSYSSGMLKTTEKAINFFYRTERDFDCVVLAHTHKLGSYMQGNVSMYEQGCCCHIEAMDYADGKLTYPQQEGFLYLCQDEEGNILTNKTRLIAL